LSFINFHTRFSSQKGRGAATLGGFEIPHIFQQSQRVLLVPHEDGTKQGWKCKSRQLVLGWHLGRSPVGVASRTCLADLSWNILWSSGLTNAA